MKQRSTKKTSTQAKSVVSRNLERIDRNVAGMDIGARSIFVCAGTSNSNLSVFEVPTFTADLKALIKKLQGLNVKSVAMEATGIYWITVYDMLQEANIEAWLVNPRDVKAIPGKKTDVLDCQRIQQLHSYDLFKRSFRPDKEIVTLRSYTRQRTTLTELAAMQINHMHKALVQMNVQIGQVVADISGSTGMQIIRAIVAGERNPLVLAKFRDARCKSNESEIAKSLEGNYKSEHILSLRQALEIYDLLKQKIVECEEEFKKIVETLITSTDQSAMSSAEIDEPSKKVNNTTQKKKLNKSSYHFDAAMLMVDYIGVDLTTLPGISENTAVRIISEIGTDMSRWATPKNFASWVGLSPGNNISGGKILSSRTKPTTNKVRQALLMAASTLYNSKTALGAHLRRLSSRIGKQKAITATAHKLAIYIYCMLRDKKNYLDVGGETYERHYEKRVVSNMIRRAGELGYDMIKRDNKPDISPAAA